MKDVEIYEQDLYDSEGKVKGKMAILRGGLSHPNPISFMNNVVHEYVGRSMHSQFVEISMDNPWVRVVISDSNKLKFKKFKKQRLGNGE